MTTNIEKIEVPTGTRPKGIGWVLHKKSDTTDTFKRKTKSVASPTFNKEAVESMLTNIMSGNLTESTETVNSILSTKVQSQLDAAKEYVARSIFGEEAEEEEDENKDFSKKHPIGQLEKIADYKKLSDDEAVERKADGSIDSRAKAWTSGECPKFHHADGSTSDIHPKHAKAILNKIQSGELGKHSQEVQDMIHGSKAGLNVIKSAMGLTD